MAIEFNTKIRTKAEPNFTLLKDILEANQFRDRHGNNNDLVVHIRLGDAIENNPGLEYYENMMARVDPYDKAWLATDEVNHPICQSLIEKYGFIPLDYNAVDTLKFGSTCRQIILSGGTFSWIMAVMGYQTQKVFYPDYNKRRIWHGDIFVFDDWIKEI